MALFDVKVGEHYLDLGDEKITLELHNQLLLVGIIRDNFSYSFKIPYTPANVRALGLAGYANSQNLRQTPLACALFIQDQLWTNGILRTEDAQAEAYIQIKLDFAWGAFTADIGDKKIKDIYPKTTPLVPPPYPYKQDLATEPTNWRYFFSEIVWNDALFPLPRNTGGVKLYYILLNGSTKATAGVSYPIETMEAVATQLVNDFNANSSVNGQYRAYLRIAGELPNKTYHVDIVPFAANSTANFELQISEITDLSPTPVVTTFPFSHYDETKPVIAQNYECLRFPYVRAAEFYGSSNPNFLGNLNRFIDGFAGVYQTNSIASFAVPEPNVPSINQYAHCPCIYLFSIITHIAQYVGWTWEGEFKDDTEIAKLLVYSNFASDQLRTIGDYQFNEHARIIYFADIVPDITIKEFFEQIQEMFGLYYEFNSIQKTIYINFKKTIMASEPLFDLAEQIAVYTQTNTTKTSQQLAYDEGLDITKYYEDSNWRGTYPKVTTNKMRAGAIPYTSDLYPALWEQKGNSPMFKLGTTNNRKMYLFFWRGYQTVGKPATTQPVAEASGIFSGYTFVPDGLGGFIPVLNGFPLAPESLIAKFWESFYEDYLLLYKPIETIIYVPLNFLFRAGRSLANRYYYDNAYYFVQKIQTEINNQDEGLSLAKLFLHRIGIRKTFIDDLP